MRVGEMERTCAFDKGGEDREADAAVGASDEDHAGTGGGGHGGVERGRRMELFRGDVRAW